MKPTTPILFVLAFLVALSVSGCTAGGQTSSSAQETEPPTPQPTGGIFAAVPLLGELTRTVVYDDIWERSQLSKRDRSLITIAALQALYRDQLRGHLNRALENGLTQEEIQEVIVHVSFYTGWPTGVNASRMAGEVFQERGLPPSSPVPTWVESSVTQESTSRAYAAVPRLGELRNSLLYGDIWERPQLSKRDRSMVTVATLQALYATNQLQGHIARALDENGVTPEELREIILHLTFYAGWPAAVNAGGLAADAFEERGIPLG